MNNGLKALTFSAFIYSAHFLLSSVLLLVRETGKKESINESICKKLDCAGFNDGNMQRVGGTEKDSMDDGCTEGISAAAPAKSS